MDQAAGRQSAFSIWLRTGLWPVEVPDAAIETKYNHWHDERDGRFTTSGAGRHDGSWQGGSTGGGGGSAGGGGASGSWRRSTVHASNSSTVRSAKPAPFAGSRAQSVTPSPAPPTLRASVSVAGSERKTVTTAGGAHVEVRNGYSFRIDGEGRTEQVSGAITLGASRRSRTAQAAAGGADRLRGDDGGHYIAVRFKGPSDAFNHFAQDANFNRGGYRALEDEWARDVRRGKSVTLTITPSYLGHSKRPDILRVFYKVNGYKKWRNFANRQQRGKASG